MKAIVRVDYGGHITYVQRWERDSLGRLFVVYCTIQSEAEVFDLDSPLANQAISDIEKYVGPNGTISVIVPPCPGCIEDLVGDSMGWSWDTPLKDPIVAPKPLQEVTGPLLSGEEIDALLGQPQLDLDGPPFEFKQGLTYQEWLVQAKKTLSADMKHCIANQLSLFSLVEVDSISCTQFQSLPDLISSLIGATADWEAWFNNDKTD